MKLIVKTESGSTYRFNWPATRWTRPVNPESLGVRTTSGDVLQLSAVKVGEPLVIIGTSLTPGLDFRRIETTPVVAIEWEDAAESAPTTA